MSSWFSEEQWLTRPAEERIRATFLFVGHVDRRYKVFKNAGWVYVMRNPALREPVFKIGQSRRAPMVRANELTKSTGVFGDFQLVYFIHVGDRMAAEAEIHRILSGHRVKQNKEFFDAPLSVILEAFDQVAPRYPVFTSKTMREIIPQALLAYRFECRGCGASNQARELLVPVVLRCRSCGEPLEQ